MSAPTTEGRGRMDHIGGAARRACVASLVITIAACGPDVHDPATWMLGVFSNVEPGPASSSLSVTQYHVSEDDDPESGETVRTVRVLDVNTTGTIDERLRSWRRRGDHTLVMLPSDNERPRDVDVQEWVITEDDECGPHVVDAVRPAGTAAEDIWNRGETCVRTSDHCNPECPIEDPYPYEVYWCDAPPEPCGEGSGSDR